MLRVTFGLSEGDRMKAKKEQIIAFDPDLQTKWKNVAEVRQRHPRTGYEEVVELVNATWPPTVFMREHEKTTDIVIRFERSSRQLPDGHREVYFDNFVPLTRVFEDVISHAPAKGENTIRWKLVTEAYRAYQLTWLRLFRVQFQNQIYPATNLRNLFQIWRRYSIARGHRDVTGKLTMINSGGGLICFLITQNGYTE
jgi:hypothetical protein